MREKIPGFIKEFQTDDKTANRPNTASPSRQRRAELRTMSLPATGATFVDELLLVLAAAR